MTRITATIPAAKPLAEIGRHAQPAPLTGAQRAGYERVKRGLDVVLATALLAACGPLMLVVALLVKLTSRGPVIFRQTRAGRGGRPFTMLKFRTMYAGAQDDREFIRHLNEQDGPVFKIRHDPRLTWLGRLLRRSSIDELPQLLNVLAGHMSLVGPRPLWLPEARQATGAARRRTDVKPGLTCLWQISGRSELSYEEWVLLDLYYIDHRGALLDLMILLQTLPAVLSGRGAY
jgi:lipopolysaccharide/colanic/teichoic acid biosynthesis glycosyltransferase